MKALAFEIQDAAFAGNVYCAKCTLQFARESGAPYLFLSITKTRCMDGRDQCPCCEEYYGTAAAVAAAAEIGRLMAAEDNEVTMEVDEEKLRRLLGSPPYVDGAGGAP